MKNNRTLPIIILSAIICIATQSCRTVYSPSTANVPLFQEKGETRINVYPSAVQAAFAITNNIGLMLNGQYRNSNTTVTTSINGGTETEQKIKTTNTGVEIGAGYFKSNERNSTIEVYAGVGIPSVNIKDEVTGSATAASYKTSGFKLFLQPSFGHVGNRFDIAFTPRFTAVKFGDPTTTYSSAQLTEYNLAEVNKSMLMYLEPMFTFRAGKNAIKLQIQTGISLNLGKRNINSQLFTGNIGLAFDFANWYKN
jgi:hypothetical protein